MARAVLRDIVFGLAATGLLMGCVEGGGKTGVDGTQVSAPGKKSSGARDIEAPEVFQTTDSALWDGRPSLGGIWVAAPDATNPERVLIFNPATGKSITGALFKRERDNPGPRLQLSSDAAEALGILAGQPTEIRVTALRKEEVAEPAPAEAATDQAGADPAAPPAGDGAEAAAIASAALDAVDAETPEAATDAAAAPAEDTGAGTGEVAAATAVAAEGAAALAPDAAPKRKTWKERRAEAKAAREEKRRAAAEAKAAAAAAAAGTAPGDGEAATIDSAAVAPIESAPLDARNPDVTEAPEPADAGQKTRSETPAPAAAVEPATDPAPAAAASGAVRPIQVASFSKEDNATRAAEALAKIGITATPQKSEKNGKAVWGVVVMGDDAMLKKIKDAGFADAYYLK